MQPVIMATTPMNTTPANDLLLSMRRASCANVTGIFVSRSALLGEPRADMTPNQIALHSRTSALQRRVEERWLAGRVELIQTKAPPSIEQRGEDAVVALRH
mmetsp:Transcript_2379/g.5700  ORF Transcript_2379/g.5700 Transcript_2379/m.5700 type:complete len:101 (-) Transcript_2379:108-410(-)